MAGGHRLEEALNRLSTAIDTVEAAVDRRLEQDRLTVGLREQMQQVEEDRARLANSLDVQTSRSERLEEANQEVSRRLVAAMESIRNVLDRHGG
ncbi:DUF4164 domain-containing protein [Coralliovum pocilloporae]|uniref:DUF4164 domain-containing protein n=1 Tax=Coralliovum pocilloporae TaxID=3066369 RepID=UPI0033079D5C